jgi:hypothetical protein
MHNATVLTPLGEGSNWKYSEYKATYSHIVYQQQENLSSFYLQTGLANSCFIPEKILAIFKQSTHSLKTS